MVAILSHKTLILMLLMVGQIFVVPDDAPDESLDFQYFHKALRTVPHWMASNEEDWHGFLTVPLTVVMNDIAVCSVDEEDDPLVFHRDIEKLMADWKVMQAEEARLRTLNFI